MREPQPDRSAQWLVWRNGATAAAYFQHTVSRQRDGRGADPRHQGSPGVRGQRPCGLGWADRGRRRTAPQEADDGVANMLVCQVHERNGGTP